MKSTVISYLVAATFSFSLCSAISHPSSHATACELTKRLYRSGENLFFSPLSISSAMAIAQAGSAGRTREQLQAALCLPDNNHAIGSWYSGVLRRLASSSCECTVANHLWIDAQWYIEPQYLSDAWSLFGACAESLDFNDPLSVDQINAWVARNTRNKIPSILQRGSISSDTPLVITNAIYFNGSWSTAFDQSRTKKDFFYADDSTVYTVDMMSATNRTVRYANTSQAAIVELPFSDKDMIMRIVLPHGPLEPLLNSLTPDHINEWAACVRPIPIDLYLPKISLKTNYSLNSVLKQLGITDAFDPLHADFSGITQDRKLWIDSVIHKASLDVSEEGAEAAAATAVVMRCTVSSGVSEWHRPIFYANRPFILSITDTQTNTVLFMGVIERF